MKKLWILPLTLISFTLVIYAFSSSEKKEPIIMDEPMNYQRYQQLWEKVYAFEVESLPKSALEIVEQIYTKAQKEENTPQIIKALLYKSKFTLLLEDDAQLKVISEFKKQIAQQHSPTKNILENILAKFYWDYFQNHRWQFYDRTQTAQKVDTTDFQTWDLKTLFKEVHIHYQASLENATLLRKKQIKDYAEIFENYRDLNTTQPITLYDFIAENALVFYKSTETRITKPTYQFKIDDPIYLSDDITFSNFKIETKDSLSLELNALKIYQDLIGSYQNDINKYTLVIKDLERLHFVYANANLPNREQLLVKTFLKYKKRYKNTEIETLFDYELASITSSHAVYEKDNTTNQFKNKEALRICENAIKKFPNSLGAQKCINLKRTILAKNIHIRGEKYIPINKHARFLVTYKNVENIYFKAYKMTQQQEKNYNAIRNDSVRSAFINGLTATKKWSATLKNEKDHLSHTTETIIPPLPSGNYLIIASNTEVLTENYGTTYGSTFMQVTDILLIENNLGDKTIYQVVNRNTGKPIKNANITLTNKHRTNRSNKSKLDKTFVTDVNGEAVFRYAERTYYYNLKAHVRYKKDRAVFGEYSVYGSRTYQKPEEEARNSTFLFTDRSIYRPGQKVHFKGILVNQYKHTSKIVPQKTLNVKLYDVNHQVVEEKTVTTNEFGSFASVFTLPLSGLTGQFYIYADRGATHFSVEEYKRPKFEAEFKPIAEAYKINDSIKLKGFAKGFAGNTITEAKVVYSVQRHIEYPRWCYYYGYANNSASQEIAFGETLTDAKGEFFIPFKAIPDDSETKTQPVFVYKVTADVTDLNGETRSTTTQVKVGYHTLIATIDIDNRWDKNKKKHSLTVTSENLNGEYAQAKGTLKIYKLIAPKNPFRSRPWQSPEYKIPEAQFRELFPNEAYTNEDQFIHWEKGDLVYSTKFDTEKSKEKTLKNTTKWISGQYVIELETKDKFNQKVTDKQFFSVYSATDTSVVDNQLFTITTDKEDYNIGDTLEVTLSAASKDLYAVLEIEKDHKIVKRHRVHLSNASQKIQIPVNEEDLGGFALHYRFVNYNDFKNGSILVSVPYAPKDLEIETQTFRDKLLPGEKQTWSFTVKGAKKDKIVAEMLAGMYDASLDAFKTNTWRFNPFNTPIYRSSYNQYDASRSFGAITLGYAPSNELPYGQLNTYSYPRYNWFGFHFENHKYYQDSYVSSLYTQRKSFDGTITGIVKDINSIPLSNIKVWVKGTEFGTYTETDGSFSIHINKEDVLYFVGNNFNSVEKSVKDFKNLEITLDKRPYYINNTFYIHSNGFDYKNAPKTLAGSSYSSRNSKLEFDYKDTEMDLAEVSEAPIVTSSVRKKSKQEVSLRDNRQGRSEREENKDTSSQGLKNVSIRKNLQETAFFYPQLKTDTNGSVSFSFTAPEALTRWKLQLLAHSKNLYSVTKTLETVTQKELMVIPNAPRFLREGDVITLSTKISNLSEKNLDGMVQLLLIDAVTGESIDHLLENVNHTKKFTVAKKGNTSASWTLSIPETVSSVQYKIVAKAGNFSDGEQNVLPVLSNRMLVTETLPLWVRSNQTKTFTLEKLKNTTSSTLKHHQLTLEVTSNPAWYAVQALPYLMEYPYECAEQTFSRYYANSLATHIVNSSPKIKKVFDTWKNTEALLSNLEKNEELKSLLIEETPWLRVAQSESEQKKRIAILFDVYRMQKESDAAIRKLAKMQMNNGGFPWFQGSNQPSRYITQHIASGFGHLEKLGVNTHKNSKMLEKAVRFLDREIVDDYQQILRNARDLRKRAKTKKEGIEAEKNYLKRNHLGHTQLYYLYMRSFYTAVQPNKETQKAMAYYRVQSATYWKEQSLYDKGLIALFQHRNKNTQLSQAITKSLKENSISSEELGMYWKENTNSWYWYQAPIETHSLLIEAFSEIENDTETIDNLKVWLLKNKQTNQWKTTKATTEAVYALLLEGSKWLSVTEAVDVKVGDIKIDPEVLDVQVEAGTGYYKTSWKGDNIAPSMSTVTFSKKGNGIAWGGLYWQYFEDLDKITSAETPLKLKKKLFIKKNDDTGKKLIEITKNTAVKLGDLITVRIELRTDRTMEFIHMKDMRAAGLEPINVLSRYKWQDGLGYYQSTKDAATHFFFSNLPKGVYVFEYDVRANNAGTFSNGITTIQSMYAPEFSSHSEGVRVNIEK